MKMRSLGGVLLAFALGGMVAACAPTTGVGTGVSRSGAVQADLSWNAQDARTGTMTARLSNGEVYQGPYFQITRETRVDELRPFWAGYGGWGWRGWHRHWAGWDYWGPDYGPQFITHYSGRVVANLTGPGGSHMRCRFRLIRPGSGMAGGGEGQCQLRGGDTLDTTFPPAG